MTVCPEHEEQQNGLVVWLSATGRKSLSEQYLPNHMELIHETSLVGLLHQDNVSQIGKASR